MLYLVSPGLVVFLQALLFLVVFDYLIFKGLFKELRKRHRKRWLDNNKELIRLVNAYRSIYHLDPNPKDYKRGTGDPKYTEDSTRQCYELCRKFKRGEIPEADVKRCQEYVEEYLRKHCSDSNG